MSRSSLVDLVRAVRVQRFVGREEPVRRFEELVRPDATARLMVVTGGAGLGKSTLLRHLEGLAFAHGCATARLDLVSVAPDTAAAASAWRAALALATPGRPGCPLVVFVDTFEAHRPLEHWYREHLFAALPADARVVLAGRARLHELWWRDEGWRELAVSAPLEPFPPEVARAYVARRGVDGGVAATIVDQARGHPLTLSLLADAALAGHVDASGPGSPDAVSQLVARVLSREADTAPSEAHARALYALALALELTRPMLERAAGPGADVGMLTDWLASRSDVARGPRGGLVLHDLYRDAVARHLKEGHHALYVELVRVLAEHVAAELASHRTFDAREASLIEYLALLRHEPMWGGAFAAAVAGRLYRDAPTDADVARIVDAIAWHEGPRSARIAARWIAAAGTGLVVFRSGDGAAVAYVIWADLAALPDALVAEDPVVRAWDAWQRGDRARTRVFRFWGDLTHHQDACDGVSATAAYVSAHSVAAPDVAHHCLVTCDPASSTVAPFVHAGILELAPCRAVVDGVEHGIATRNLAAEGVFEVLRRMLDVTFRPPRLATEPEATRRQLRDLLDHYTDDGWLLADPFAARLAGGGDVVAGARARIEAATAAIAAIPRDEVYARVIEATWLRPVGKQRAAAFALNLSYASYRRYLVRARDELARQLGLR